jgi:hypothetical protein
VKPLILLAALAWAQPPETQTTDPTQTEEEAEARRLRDRLAQDPAAQGSLAQRIARSRLAEKITSKTDTIGKIADIQQWIKQNPDSATQLMIGLATDDATGDKRFEDLAGQGGGGWHLVANAGAQGNLFNRLKKAGLESKLMKQAANENMADEERNEIIKSMFEGKSAAGGNVLTQQMTGGGKAPTSEVFNSGYYDRLSAGNLHGYSPQLQALQSSLNARRVPGAPKLIETGKLDYETLSYPGYGMRFDLDNLRKRLSYERAWALAKLLGREKEFSQSQLQDPSILALLEKAAGEKGGGLSRRFAKRQAALERAAAAVAGFDSAALPAKEPMNITRALLSSLGGRQREAARWITIAGLEEELQRLDLQEGFLSPELEDQIARCPVSEDLKIGYKRRGQEYLRGVKELKARDEAATAALERDDWLEHMETTERVLAEAGTLRRGLSEKISDYVAAAYRLSSLVSTKPYWRQAIDSWLMRVLPSISYSRGLKAEARQRDVLKDVFAKIAIGDVAAAHTILASGAP